LSSAFEHDSALELNGSPVEEAHSEDDADEGTNNLSEIVLAEGTLTKFFSVKELYFIVSLPLLPRRDVDDDAADVGDRISFEADAIEDVSGFARLCSRLRSFCRSEHVIGIFLSSFDLCVALFELSATLVGKMAACMFNVINDCSSKFISRALVHD
jgi:hypothetical protein